MSAERQWYGARAQVAITHPTYRPADPKRQANFYFERPSTSRLDPPPWIGGTSLSEAPWQQPYLWRETLDPGAPDAQPYVLHPPPEGRQPRTDHSDTNPPYYAPEMPVMYGPQNRSDPLLWRQDQPSMLPTASYFPTAQRPFEDMTPHERSTFVQQSQRDSFINKLYQDVDTLVSERQYEHLPNFNRLEDRDLYVQYMFGASWDNPSGNFSLRPNFKDKNSQLALKYHVFP